MVIYESYVHKFRASKDMKKNTNNDKRIFPAYLLAYSLTLIVKNLKISVEKCRVVTTLNIIKH